MLSFSLSNLIRYILLIILSSVMLLLLKQSNLSNYADDFNNLALVFLFSIMSFNSYIIIMHLFNYIRELKALASSNKFLIFYDKDERGCPFVGSTYEKNCYFINSGKVDDCPFSNSKRNKIRAYLRNKEAGSQFPNMLEYISNSARLEIDIILISIAFSMVLILSNFGIILDLINLVLIGIITAFLALTISKIYTLIFNPNRENRDSLWRHIDYFSYSLIYAFSLSTILGFLIYLTKYNLKFDYYLVSFSVILFLIIETYLILNGEPNDSYSGQSLLTILTPSLVASTPLVLIYFILRYRKLNLFEKESLLSLWLIPKYHIRNPSWLQIIYKTMGNEMLGKGGSRINIEFIDFPISYDKLYKLFRYKTRNVK